MKYRNDFVTNSSSSSFIVVFKSVAEKKGHFENLRNNYAEYAQIIIDDIENNKVSKDDALKEIKKAIESEAFWKYYYNTREYWASTGTYVNPYKDPKIQRAVKEYVDVGMTKVLQELPKRGYYAIVEYGDDDSFYSELEHHIMPYQPFVYKSISHH